MKDWTRKTEYRWDHIDGSFIALEIVDGQERYRLFNQFRRELSNGKTLERMVARHAELKDDFPAVFRDPVTSGMKNIESPEGRRADIERMKRQG